MIGVPLFIVGGSVAIYALGRSDFWTRVEVPLHQPVPFSHQHHVDGLGIDCRYCHTSVESSSFAGLPPTETCMTCHSQIWKDAPVLQPVRDSLQTGTPIKWTRVHDLPDYVYFDHSIHVNKGIGCATCHGRVDQMPITWKTKPLYMRWCLSCHRQPETALRPTDEVFNMKYRAPGNQTSLGQQLITRNHVRQQGLTDCYTCHR
ncbi:MAG: cytochrome c3 family protein [Verrucomicrobiota bacterium]|nr:cytochrome c3 family protein [Verrucomicrobiota bacterium]MDQ2918803.1 cytochrome c3 family protein [Verrucomicrobiota bacterium]